MTKLVLMAASVFAVSGFSLLGKDGTVPTAETDLERNDSMDQVSAREVNMFHLALLDRALNKINGGANVGVNYGGIVLNNGALISDPKGLVQKGQLRIAGDIGNPLVWSVIAEHGGDSFSLWISVRKTQDTIGECPLGKRSLFVNFDEAEKNRAALTQKREELGGLSIQEFVNFLKEVPQVRNGNGSEKFEF